MKKTIYLLYALSVLCSTSTLMAQINTDLRPQVKSPEVNKFEQYMNMPVNLVSGTPQVSIPIYTLEYGGMTLPISLEYDASGVKVESIASSVGQNWSLNVGGVVSRIVKGAPDEGNPYNWTARSQIQINGFYRDYGLTKLNELLSQYKEVNFNYSIDALGGHKASEFSFFLFDLSNGLRDSQPDLFYFSTPQGGGKYIFNDNREVVYLENTDFRVKENFLQNDFKSWDVTSPKGIKYKFGRDNASGYQGRDNDAETSFTLAYSPDGQGGSDNQYIVNSWFLSEIKNLANNNSIGLNYIANDYKHKIIPNQSRYMGACYLATIYGNSTNYASVEPNGSGCNMSESGMYDTYTQPSSAYLIDNKVMSKLISKIVAGDTEITFIYASRDDLEPLNLLSELPKKLTEIQVKYKGQCVKKFTFNYTATLSPDSGNLFLASYEDTYSRKRFFLTSVIESNCITPYTEKPYYFNYNTTDLPSKISYAQDKWGYYNGKLKNINLYPQYNLSTIVDSNYGNRSIDFSFAKAGSLQKITYPTKGSVNFEYEPHLGSEITDVIVSENPSSYIIQELQPQPQGLFTNPSNESTFIYPYNKNSNKLLSVSCTLYSPNPRSGNTSYCSGTNASTAMEIIDLSTGKSIAMVSYNQLKKDNSNNNGYGYGITSTTVRMDIDPTLLEYNKKYSVKVYGTVDCHHNITKIAVYDTTNLYTVGGLRIKKITHQDYTSSIIKESNYTYYEPKTISNPKKAFFSTYNFKEQWAVFSTLASSNGSPFISYSNLSFINKYFFTQSPEAYTTYGKFGFVSSGKDIFPIDFMGPNITYGTVEETNGNGTIKNVFNFYKSYFELNGYTLPRTLPAAPKFQSILAGEKNNTIISDATKKGLSATNYEYNVTTSNVKVNAINALRMGTTSGGVTISGYTLQGQVKTLKTETETTSLKGQDVTVTKDYEYAGVEHFQPTKITTANSKGEQLISKMYYPNDLQNEPLMIDLKTQNRKANPVRTENYNGTTKLSEQKMSYAKDATTSNLVLPKSVYGAKFPNSVAFTTNVGNLEKKLTYDSYDSSGNLTQYTPEGGAPVIIIWGYNKTQPIAKIENATTAQIMSALGVSDLSTVNESNLGAINALRQSLSSAMITTYIHIPLVGVSSITDPKGQTIFYNYDGLGRLQNVKDAQGNILSENEYHYKN